MTTAEVLGEGQVATHIGTTGDDVILGTNGPDVIVALDGDDDSNGQRAD